MNELKKRIQSIRERAGKIKSQLIKESFVDWKKEAFNGCVDTAHTMEDLIERFQIQEIIETGTGKDTCYLAQFIPVKTIEKDMVQYRSNRHLEAKENITPWQGDSEFILPDVLKTVKKTPILFYLHTHKQSCDGIINELNHIAKSPFKDACIIVIDKIMQPDKDVVPLALKEEQCIQDKDIKKIQVKEESKSHLLLTLEQLQPALSHIYENLYYAYLPCSTRSHAYLICAPLSWAEKQGMPETVTEC